MDGDNLSAELEDGCLKKKTSDSWRGGWEQHSS